MNVYCVSRNITFWKALFLIISCRIARVKFKSRYSIFSLKYSIMP